MESVHVRAPRYTHRDQLLYTCTSTGALSCWASRVLSHRALCPGSRPLQSLSQWILIFLCHLRSWLNYILLSSSSLHDTIVVFFGQKCLLLVAGQCTCEIYIYNTTPVFRSPFGLPYYDLNWWVAVMKVPKCSCSGTKLTGRNADSGRSSGVTVGRGCTVESSLFTVPCKPVVNTDSLSSIAVHQSLQTFGMFTLLSSTRTDHWLKANVVGICGIAWCPTAKHWQQGPGQYDFTQLKLLQA